MTEMKISVAAILSRLADALSTLSSDELRRLSDPSFTIEIKTIRPRIKDAPLKVQDTSVEDAIVQITQLPSRQQAQVFLDSNFPSKKALELIARKLDIPIIRHDRVEDLRDKIVEATVGARIRSQAIQGTAGPDAGDPGVKPNRKNGDEEKGQEIEGQNC